MVTVSDQVAERIVRLRKARSMTRDGLAAACAAVGRPDLTGPSLANIETGRRSLDGQRRREISVDELCVFAKALDVSIAQLLAQEACSVCDGLPPAGLCCNVCGAGKVTDVAAVRKRFVPRRRVTPDLLTEVAELYRSATSAGLAPVVEIARKANVSHSTAGRWVVEARRAGIMGPAVGTRVGEATNESGEDE